MSDDFVWTKFDIGEFRRDETDTYSVWVYAEDEVLPQVFEEKMPNTEEVWFSFYKFNHFYWKLLEDECIEDFGNSSFYSYNKLREFMLRRMLCATSIPSVIVEYGSDGFLTERSFESVMRVHPRILRVLMGKIEFFPKPMDDEDERELEKQCSILFGKGEAVVNPHPHVTMYCNLMAFWEKFGMNYFDLLRLPQDVFSILKKIMTLENTNKSAKIEDKPKPQQPPPRNRRSIKF